MLRLVAKREFMEPAVGGTADTATTEAVLEWRRSPW